MGWYDPFGVKADGSQTLEEGESCSYTAKWKSVKVVDVYAKHYKDLTVPAGVPFKLNFSLLNQGNANAGRLTIKLVPENAEAVTVAKDELSTNSLMAGFEKSGSFNVALSGNAGDTLKADIVVTDADGNTWTEPVVFTIAE